MTTGRWYRVAYYTQDHCLSEDPQLFFCGRPVVPDDRTMESYGTPACAECKRVAAEYFISTRSGISRPDGKCSAADERRMQTAKRMLGGTFLKRGER